MRKLIVAQHISLDGVVQSPGGPDEDPGGGFDLGGWVEPYADETTGQAAHDIHAQPFELLLGRRTYDIWAAYWPRGRSGHALADVFNRVRKHVATHRPESLEWHNSHGLNGDLGDAVRALKAREGADLLTWGSGAMVGQLLAEGLVDELRLLTYPVVLGHGKRLFGPGSRASAFTLSQSMSSSRGVVVAHYVQSGEVGTGAFNETEEVAG